MLAGLSVWTLVNARMYRCSMSKSVLNVASPHKSMSEAVLLLVSPLQRLLCETKFRNFFISTHIIHPRMHAQTYIHPHSTHPPIHPSFLACTVWETICYIIEPFPETLEVPDIVKKKLLSMFTLTSCNAQGKCIRYVHWHDYLSNGTRVQ